ncbi:MAG: 2-oxoacid:acceptor oxidoreductase family protein [Nanoarchaeota archaeon]|nr:2-oxoacid:acceptor oxidoreductase family protein [Nanoarchaeota archaeon]
MKYSILFGGKAGQGSNILSNILADALVKKGFYVFNSRDYPSLIRGGHNFNVLTFSEKPVYSNESKINMIVALDELTIKNHKSKLVKKGVVLEGKFLNMYFAGMLFHSLGLDFSLLKNELKKLKRFEENIKQAKQGYDSKKCCVTLPKTTNKKLNLSTGSVSLSWGAIKSGLDIYYAYPMTPATPVLVELAQMQKKNNLLVLELENEIAVANAGVGSSITGAKTMVGTSGGGFALMSEVLSMAGIAGVPLVFYLAQRKGPASGVATYQEQGDLQFARGSGHGEFPRIILAPGDEIECEELASQAFYLSQKFGNPSIIISDKHLAESFYTSNKKAKITKSRKLTKFGRYNSYEKDPITGSATEEAEIVKKNVENRLKKGFDIVKEAEKLDMFKIYDNNGLEASPKNIGSSAYYKNLNSRANYGSKNCVVFWGSTKGAVLDAIKDLNVCAIQILYIEPFSKKVEKLLKGKNLILVENNATGQLGNLIREKTGIEIKNKILRYDGRPFLSDELGKEIKRFLK